MDWHFHTDMKLDEKKCKYCYGKRYYTVLYGIHVASDFEMGEKVFEETLRIHKIACSKCNKNNRRKIKGIKSNWWSN